MFEPEEYDSSVLRKSISEDDEWEKDEVEEVVLTSTTDREPAVHATLDSLSCQDFGLGELTYADEPLADNEYISTSRSITGKWIKGEKGKREVDARKSPESSGRYKSMVSSFKPSLNAIVQQAKLGSVPLVKYYMLLDYALT